MAWSPEAAFFLFATVVQLALGIAIVVRRPRVEWCLVLGALFVLNGGLSLNSLLVHLGVYGGGSGGEIAPRPGGRIFFTLDRATTLLIGYLGLAYPRRPGRAARRPWLLPLAFGLLAASVVVPHLMGAPVSVAAEPGDAPAGCPDPCPVKTPFGLWSNNMPSFGFLVILVRWAWLLPATRSPLELHQFKLIFAAFAVRALHVVLMFSPTWSFEAFARGDLDWGVGTVIGLAGPLAGLSAVTASVVLLVRSRRNRRSEVRGAAGFVLVFCLVGFAEYAVVQAMRLLEFGLTSYIYSPFQQLDLMVLRPALVFYAMLRHDLVGRIRHARPLGLAAVAALAFASYSAGLVSSLGRAPGNSAFYLALSLAAAAGLTWATLAALGPSLDAPVAASRKASSALEAFTAAMEDAYRNGEPSREQRGILEARRRRLGVPREQAKALELAVQTRWAGTVDAAEWHAGETLRGRYRVERLLGEGGGGAAYLATDLLESRPVVLKRTHRLDEPAQKAFLREAFLLARLNHPRIVRLLRSETLGRETILVLDYAAGGSLATRLARKPLSDAEAVRLAHDVLDAMRTAHEAGIVHRDIKPSNILLDAQGRAMLSDFGVARENRGAPDLVTHTATSDRPPGSLHYMSPEQVQGFPVDARSDLYSFGVVLAEAVGGSPHPTHPTTDYEIRRAIVEGPAPRLPLRVSGRLATAIQAATRKEPAQRVGSARDLALLLGPSTMKKKQQAPAHAEHIARRQGT